MTIYLATDDGVAVLRQDGSYEALKVELQLRGLDAYCLAADPEFPERVYCGTFGAGLWRTPDGGKTWSRAGEGVPYAEVMSVAVSPLERVDGHGVVWAGTEPSAVYRSEDGGDSWEERPALRRLPSAPTWSFPPRPWTHHVRWIAPDPLFASRMCVGIELGGVMRSLDFGLTWEDRKPNGQHDAHTLATHPLAPGRVYEAAGGGYAESRDGGETWQRYDAGMSHHYVWGLAVDPADPNTIVVSACRGAQQAHSPQLAESRLYRRSGGGPWEEVRNGLPEPKRQRAYVLATLPTEPTTFY
ncbi:MAG: hypothetical protein M3281_01370, partial [Chloroflexota bacterium]|nr:hypothetical protein [Chloroflexota bacterium]